MKLVLFYYFITLSYDIHLLENNILQSNFLVVMSIFNIVLNYDKRLCVPLSY